MAKHGAEAEGRVGHRRRRRDRGHDPKAAPRERRDTASGRFARAKATGGSLRRVRRGR